MLCVFEYLCCRPLTRTDSAVDRAVRYGRGLGPGPMNSTERLAQQVPVAREDARAEVRERAPARLWLVEPCGLDDLGW